MKYEFNKHFTLLELLIAVIIFLIVSVIVAAVYSTTISAYRKGTEHVELTQSLSGTFMVMESDLSKLIRINDEENVYFKPNEFSFIATATENVAGNDYTYLQLIKYRIDESQNMLFKNFARYPDDVDHIDDEPILFLSNIDKVEFKYVFKEENEDDEEKKNKQNNEQISFSENNDLIGNKSNKDEEDSEVQDIEIPLGIKISGDIYDDNRKFGECFQTSVTIPYFEIQKSEESDDKDDKKNDKEKNENKKE